MASVLDPRKDEDSGIPWKAVIAVGIFTGFVMLVQGIALAFVWWAQQLWLHWKTRHNPNFWRVGEREEDLRHAVCAACTVVAVMVGIAFAVFSPSREFTYFAIAWLAFFVALYLRIGWVWAFSKD